MLRVKEVDTNHNCQKTGQVMPHPFGQGKIHLQVGAQVHTPPPSKGCLHMIALTSPRHLEDGVCMNKWRGCTNASTSHGGHPLHASWRSYSAPPPPPTLRVGDPTGDTHWSNSQRSNPSLPPLAHTSYGRGAQFYLHAKAMCCPAPRGHQSGTRWHYVHGVTTTPLVQTTCPALPCIKTPSCLHNTRCCLRNVL